MVFLAVVFLAEVFLAADRLVEAFLAGVAFRAGVAFLAAVRLVEARLAGVAFRAGVAFLAADRLVEARLAGVAFLAADRLGGGLLGRGLPGGRGAGGRLLSRGGGRSAGSQPSLDLVEEAAAATEGELAGAHQRQLLVVELAEQGPDLGGRERLVVLDREPVLVVLP